MVYIRPQEISILYKDDQYKQRTESSKNKL